MLFHQKPDRETKWLKMSNAIPANHQFINKKPKICAKPKFLSPRPKMSINTFNFEDQGIEVTENGLELSPVKLNYKNALNTTKHEEKSNFEFHPKLI